MRSGTLGGLNPMRRPWLMLHADGRRRLPDAHTRRQIRAGLGSCCLTLADAACPMPTCHARCVVTLSSCIRCADSNLNE
ncbi:hypothetical protein H5410_014758 [Solanum commersonii]|uniref:Uncharacterized protein n=1 Tax=Solanum commersonii TaxID=4109 RepID=A0A9J5ZRV0_SOLCO|nr:hypothetical protein H5410_014758 [Solanum commersonii]